MTRHWWIGCVVLCACSGETDSPAGSAGSAGEAGSSAIGGSGGVASGGAAGAGGQSGSGASGGGGSAGAAIGPRNLHQTVDLETGQLQPSASLHDSLRMTTMVGDGPTQSIAAITNGKPALVTVTAHGYSELTAVTFRDVAGMTELSGRMFRARNVTANTFELWEDHPPGGSNPGQTTLGTFAVDTTGFGSYAGGGESERWEAASVPNGGAAAGDNLDGRVVQSATVGGKLVTPRKGDHFLKTEIFYDKDYSLFAGNSGKNKPRINFHTVEDHQGDYDTETWVAFSIYLPEDFEHETETRGDIGSNQIWRVTGDSGPSGGDTAYINLFVPNGKPASGGPVVAADDVTHYVTRFSMDATSTNGGGPNQVTEWFDLGSVVPDLGKWTDFVIRYRLNPFTKQTNASSVDPDGKDQIYPGNKGIFQVWKSQGEPDANGDRPMALLIDKRNEPVGYVPHQSNRISHHWRQYKYGWHHHPTAVQGPIFIGFDEFRFGETVRDGTSFSDVHPSQLPMPGAP
jgi:hypothetical protein